MDANQETGKDQGLPPLAKRCIQCGKLIYFSQTEQQWLNVDNDTHYCLGGKGNQNRHALAPPEATR
jgi:hypothetical protein